MKCYFSVFFRFILYISKVKDSMRFQHNGAEIHLFSLKANMDLFCRDFGVNTENFHKSMNPEIR